MRPDELLYRLGREYPEVEYAAVRRWSEALRRAVETADSYGPWSGRLRKANAPGAPGELVLTLAVANTGARRFGPEHCNHNVLQLATARRAERR